MDLFPMSLINKMLQDLDARRSDVTGADGYGPQIRPVQAPPGFHIAWWIALALGTALLAVSAWSLLRPAPLSGRVDTRGPITSGKKIAPVNANAALASSAGNGLAAASAAASQAPASPHAAPVSPAPPNLAVDKPIAMAQLPAPAVSSASLKPAPRVAAKTAAAAPARKLVVADKVALAAKKAPIAYAPPPKATAAERPPAVAPSIKLAGTVAQPNLTKQIKEFTPQQRSDNEYRKAVLLIMQGMSTEAITGLEQALQLDSQNAAARQTLIGLLVENKRQEEALRTARVGLNLDSAQPGLAMIAARLQLEKGGLRTAIDTLEKTLPHAADRSDYQSFLAALLQRDGRHKEAVEHYLIALQKAPQNGVWWMGLGISFQSDHRPAEAQEAFSKAKASNTLSPELLAFVESKLRQLQR
jgi:MSHA biogenesis protein MshN